MGIACSVSLPINRINRNVASSLEELERYSLSAYKPLCTEYPPGLTCGRWYRLQVQEDAKKRGFLPLLKVMFCCCCDPYIEEV
ncbi:hypothetical protein PoB_003824200 [Plakobranchus ocellatus]|uniref:Uncharacterized protein n=1 Tax=Plakobranchus ocellatus TaxID=259542 RepID=A0AAV4AWT4_9GAST|nr:hypothetical protein PoB_003824200 [Plakobranchus ocellatus]